MASYASVKTALESVGIADTAPTSIQTGRALGKLLSSISERVTTQAIQDLLYNQSSGEVERDDIPAHAVMVGLVSAIGEFIGWDISKAGDLCVDLLEDVNAHKEAAAVRAILDRADDELP